MLRLHGHPGPVRAAPALAAGRPLAFIACVARRDGSGPSKPCRRLQSLVSSSSPSSSASESPTTATAADPYAVAGMRLQSLLDAAAWDGGEEVRQELLTLPIGSRMTFFTNIACLLMAAAVILAIVTNEDPLGGMSLSDSSLHHALLGALYALPLMLNSLAGRLPRVRRAFPVLDALHDVQDKVLEPMVKGLDAPQMIIVCLTATLPCLLLMLPAMHGSMLVLGHAVQAKLLAPAGVHIPGSVGRELAVLIPTMGSSYLSAFLVARQLSVKRSQFQALQSAVTHSDRYFKLSESMALQSADSAQQSTQVSEAFKTVSLMWILMRRKVSQLAFVLTALNMCYVSMIWADTDDLSTPLACAMLSFGFEMLLSRRSLAAKERAIKRLRREMEEKEEREQA